MVSAEGACSAYYQYSRHFASASDKLKVKSEEYKNRNA